MSQENTVTGSLEIKSNLSADFDSQPALVDSDLVAKFTKGILGANPVNLKVITGTFTPANNTLNIFGPATNYKPGLFLLLVSNPVVMSIPMQDAINGTPDRCSLPVDGILMFRPNLAAAGSGLAIVALDGRTGIANEMTQGLLVKYALYMLEDESIAEG